MKGTMAQWQKWRGFTNDEVAKALDVNPATLVRYKQGYNMPVKKALTFASLMNVDINDIIFGANSNEDRP